MIHERTIDARLLMIRITYLPKYNAHKVMYTLWKHTLTHIPITLIHCLTFIIIVRLGQFGVSQITIYPTWSWLDRSLLFLRVTNDRRVATTENIVTTKPSNRDNAIMMVKDRKCGTLYRHERWYLSVSVGYYIFFLMAITIIPSRVYFWYASTLFIARKDKRRRRHRRRCVNKELRTIYK